MFNHDILSEAKKDSGDSTVRCKQRKRSDKALSSTSALSPLPMTMNKETSQVTHEDIKNPPMEMTTKHHRLVSLLHLDNQSGLQYFIKHKSLDYDTLERYLYSDIIPGQSVSTNPIAESETEEEDDSTC